MTNADRTSANPSNVSLVVSKMIRARVETVFDAWTQPVHLMKWWGPSGVTCTAAEVDLRVGGRYRLANQFPDGNIVWIAGEFELIERPHRLVYSWRLEMPGPMTFEKVTVRFEAMGESTQVTVEHKRIADEPTRNVHEQGWHGCLDGLAEYLSPEATGGGK